MNLSNLNVEKLIANIKMACVRHNPPMKMKDLYEKSGVSSSLLSQWNTGKTQPSIAKITAIADALGVPVEQLVGDQVVEWHSRGQRFDPAYLHQKKVPQIL